MFRIGIGHDTHRLVTARPLVLGGAVIPFERGSDGHSDGDALTHAITDAILGALCEADLGVHFPDTDPQWKDANSMQLLGRVVWLAHERGEHIGAMRENLAAALNAEIACVSIKAKTGEGLDAVGRGEAVSAQAVVLLRQK